MIIVHGYPTEYYLRTPLKSANVFLLNSELRVFGGMSNCRQPTEASVPVFNGQGRRRKLPSPACSSFRHNIGKERSVKL